MNAALKKALICLDTRAVIVTPIGFHDSAPSLTPSANTIFYNQATGIQNYQRITALDRATARANPDVIVGTLTG